MNTNMATTIFMDNTTDPEVVTQSATKGAITAFILLLAVLIIFSNGMVICFYIFKSNVRKHVSVFILNLVVVDFQNGLLAVPLSAFRAELSTSTNTSLCLMSSVWPPILLLAVISSVFLVAGDRLISILSPFKYNQIVTAPRKALAITAVWVWSVIFGFAPMIGSPTPGGIRIAVFQGEIVDSLCDDYYVYTQTYIILYLVLGILIPLTAIISIYIAMYKIAQRHTKAINEIRTPSDDSDFEVKGGKVSKMVKISKAAKTTFIMSALFVLCWVPFMIVLQLLILSRISALSNYIEESNMNIAIGPAAFFAFLVSCVNPIIYSLRTPALKHNLRATFCWICQRNKIASIPGKERDLDGSMVY